MSDPSNYPESIKFTGYVNGQTLPGSSKSGEPILRFKVAATFESSFTGSSYTIERKCICFNDLAKSVHASFLEGSLIKIEGITEVFDTPNGEAEIVVVTEVSAPIGPMRSQSPAEQPATDQQAQQQPSEAPDEPAAPKPSPELGKAPEQPAKPRGRKPRPDLVDAPVAAKAGGEAVNYGDDISDL